MKHFLLFPPIWLERILSKIPAYRNWVIKQAFLVIKEDILK